MTQMFPPNSTVDNTMTPIRVVVVDDSPTIRALIKLALQAEGDILVVGEAGDPYEARSIVRETSPDVITLDVNMPRMSGLEFLKKIMRLRPTPVIMVSSETGLGGTATIAALAAGAIDCVHKSGGGDINEAFAELARKVRAASKIPKAMLGKKSRHEPEARRFQSNGRIVTIGASTGGVDALLSLLSAFPENCPPTLITQHMPEKFTSSFAHRLNSNCAPHVIEATNGAPIEPGRVYIAPGGNMHLTLNSQSKPRCRLVEGPPVSGHRPSVNVLFDSAVRLGVGAVGVILTGMGQDGASGLQKMLQNGALTIGQNEKSSLVYGMPRAAAERGAVQLQLPIEEIPDAILTACNSYH